MVYLLKKDPPKENIEENVKVMELDETQSLSENSGEGRMVEEDDLDYESDWSTDSERGKGEVALHLLKLRLSTVRGGRPPGRRKLD